jgi:hypothetical protein
MRLYPFCFSCFRDYHFNYGIKRRNSKVWIEGTGKPSGIEFTCEA